MGDEKTRLVLTIEEKLSIFNYKESHLRVFHLRVNFPTSKNGSNLQ